jgi:hypothetical protein
VRVQRQVVGKQINILRQQFLQALLHPAHHTPVLPTPKQAVVHKYSVRLGGNRRVNQGQRGCDP